MRQIMMTIGSTVLVLGSSFAAFGQDKAPAQAPMQAPKGEVQAPKSVQAPVQAPKGEVQAPVQAPKSVQAPVQAPQKIVPVQAPTQAPYQKHTQAPTQSPVQKGHKDGYTANLEDNSYAMVRPGLFRRYR